MMSKRLAVLDAVTALVQLALPGSEVLGLASDALAPTRIGEGGRAVVRAGDPGEPEMTLGVLTYTYEHRIPIDLTVAAGGDLSREEKLDAMGVAIGQAVAADRTLGGLVEWLEIEPLTTDDIYTAGAGAAREGGLALVASYTTSNPLT